MFSLNRKIEEIREKPEHIRIRYVWGMVAVCMFLIIVIWVFSVQENFQNINFQTESLNMPSGDGIQSGLEQSIEDEAESISDLDPEEIQE